MKRATLLTLAALLFPVFPAVASAHGHRHRHHKPAVHHHARPKAPKAPKVAPRPSVAPTVAVPPSVPQASPPPEPESVSVVDYGEHVATPVELAELQQAVEAEAGGEPPPTPAEEEASVEPEGRSYRIAQYSPSFMAAQDLPAVAVAQVLVAWSHMPLPSMIENMTPPGFTASMASLSATDDFPVPTITLK
jgi:hypothetical protein